MAETKTLRTRIKLLYKSYAEWQAIQSTFYPLAGEVCLSSIPQGAGKEIVMAKVGVWDGVEGSASKKSYAELEYLYANSASTFPWAEKEHLDWNDMTDEFKQGIIDLIGGTASDTLYQIVTDGANKWKLQKSEDKGETWVDATGVIDVSGLDSKIEAEIARAKAEEAKKVVQEIDSDNGKSFIWNELSGGGARFEHVDGTQSFIGVNDGGKDGMVAQIYADRKEDGSWVGSRVNVYHDGIFYVSKENQKAGYAKNAPDMEIATKKDVADLHIAEYSLTKEADPGDYAAIYHLTKDGVAVGEAINIAKDQLLKSVEIKVCVERDEPIAGLEVGDKYMDFTFIVEKGAEAHTYIAIKDMVKPYTAGEGIVIGSDNSIAVDTEVIASVEYVDDSISDTMNFIIQERDTEKAAREAGDDLLTAEIAKKTAEHIEGANGDSYIWNESSGGGARFVHKDGSEAFVGVNDGGKDGLMVQIYADVQKEGKWSGSRINAYNEKIYYTSQAAVDAGVEKNDSAHEIATIGDISAASEGVLGQANAYTDEKVDALDGSLAAIAKTGNVNDLIQDSGDVLILDCNL